MRHRFTPRSSRPRRNRPAERGARSDLRVLARAVDPAADQGVRALGMLLEQLVGDPNHLRQQIRVAQEVRDAELDDAGLPRAEHLARTTELEILLRDGETVVRP